MNMGIIYLIGALLYVLFPRDLVPDFLAGWGWLDDATVLYLLWRYYRRQRQRRQAPNGGDRRGPSVEDRHRHGTDTDERAVWDPHAVLEVDPNASDDEVKAAYRRLVAQYHPDKVQHLGKDLQALAEARFKDIQRAYEELISA